MKVNCISCDVVIPEARLKAVPGTKECVKCSTEDKVGVQVIISGKNTYSEVEVIKNKETQKDIERITGRGRRGFGSMLYKGGKGSKEFTDVKLIKRDYIPAANTRVDPNAYQLVKGKIDKYFDIIFSHDIEKAKKRSLRIINEEFTERLIDRRMFVELKAYIDSK